MSGLSYQSVTTDSIDLYTKKFFKFILFSIFSVQSVAGFELSNFG
jgi:hypothetical protein